MSKIKDEKKESDKRKARLLDALKNRLSEERCKEWFFTMKFEAAILYCGKHKWIHFDGQTFNIMEHCSEFKKTNNLNLEEMIDSVRIYEKMQENGKNSLL